ncbi:PREDICTED: uncharacterized protein LOC104612962 [Nelumbo nucifera]|uniref:Bromo domain-containing protein n=2 Tax=Nelumbo nucifera TaxID=4432 RepID=A0A822Z5B6_NELNU|nr:PREDICTED: uncharacterized protein LOC104612962 [Nelumbo nucifera]DAD38559.1 TPA_asm: hypothetical protein HUJ06_012881 [Nelumbo nucifera]
MAETGRRRSARLSALEACKVQQATSVGDPPDAPQHTNNGKRPLALVEQDTPRKRGRKKRRLRTVEEVVVNSVSREAEQERENLKDEGHTTNIDQSSKVASSSWMIEKQKLELILDILQMRDKHEIFAEPVDPEEVDGYYEIIKEPMDFGTMRAKLHEGMYTTLEQFEHDVFLIFSNAMRFNSSTTIFFRQALAIQELAKKVFQALKIDPENFAMEFLVMRRRHGRKPHHGTRCSNLNADKVRPNSMTIDVPLDGRPCFLHGPSSHRKSFQTYRGSSSANHIDRRDYEKQSVSISEPRCTYSPWTSFLNENESIASTIYYSSKQLMQVNHRGLGYRESLKRFIKDLGPTAQKVANQKLQECQVRSRNYQVLAQTSVCQNLSLKDQVPGTYLQQEPISNGETKSSMSWNILDKFSERPTVLADARERSHLLGAIRGKVAHENQPTEIKLGSHFPVTCVAAPRFLSIGETHHSNQYSRMVSDSNQLGKGVQPADLASTSPQSMLANQNDITELHSGLHFPAGNFRAPKILTIGDTNSSNQYSTMMDSKLDKGVQPAEIASVPSQSRMDNQNETTGLQSNSHFPVVSFGTAEFPASRITNSFNEHSTMILDAIKSDKWVQPGHLGSEHSQSRLAHQNPITEIQLGTFSIADYRALKFQPFEVTNPGNGYSALMVDSSSNKQVKPAELGSTNSQSTRTSHLITNTSSEHPATMADLTSSDKRVYVAKLGSEYSQARFLGFLSTNNNITVPSPWYSEFINVSSSSQAADPVHGFLLDYLDGENHSMGSPSHNLSSSQGGPFPGYSQLGCGENQAITAPNNNLCLVMEEQLAERCQPRSWGQQVAFDASCLQSSLSQLNVNSLSKDAFMQPTGQDVFAQPDLQLGLGPEEVFVDAAARFNRVSISSHQTEQSSQVFIDNRQMTLLDNHQLDLALQL